MSHILHLNNFQEKCQTFGVSEMDFRLIILVLFFEISPQVSGNWQEDFIFLFQKNCENKRTKD